MEDQSKNRRIILNPSRRRYFGNVAGVGAAATVGMGFSGLARSQAIGGRRKTLVFVFLRGGMDGLSCVVPRESGAYGAQYLQNRDFTRVNNVIPWNSDFGLHEFCGGLDDLYATGNLAIIQACGHKDPATYTRSHFDAQEQVDLGTPGEQSTLTGWLTRYLETANDAPSQPLFSALVSGGNPPVSVNGWPDVASVDSASGFSPAGGYYEGAHLELLQKMYQGTGGLDQAVSTAMLAIEEIRELDLNEYTPAGTVEYPNTGIGDDFKLVAGVIRANLGVGVATVDYGGWDTHNTQDVNNQFGSYARRLRELSDALSVFYKDMIAAGYEDDVAVIVQSEFGRQIKENSNRGTDHGLGNPMMLLGSSNFMNAGLFGNFPGLTNTPGNALIPTTDFRDVMISAAHGLLGNPAFGGGESQIFPGHTHEPISGLIK